MIGILIGIVFLVLLGKAIAETIWGTLCLAWGVTLYIIAAILDGLGYILDGLGYIRDGFQKLWQLARW